MCEIWSRIRNKGNVFHSRFQTSVANRRKMGENDLMVIWNNMSSTRNTHYACILISGKNFLCHQSVFTANPVTPLFFASDSTLSKGWRMRNLVQSLTANVAINPSWTLSTSEWRLVVQKLESTEAVSLVIQKVMSASARDKRSFWLASMLGSGSFFLQIEVSFRIPARRKMRTRRYESEKRSFPSI